MKKHALKIYVSLLALTALFIAVNVIIGRAQDPAQAQTPPDYCATEFTSILSPGEKIRPFYNDPNISTEDVISLYHETMNEQFNYYISTMIAAESAAAKIGQSNPNGRPPEPVSADNPQVLQDCPKDGTNYSTYCVAERLMDNESFGYIAYRRALDCRRGKLFETTQEEDLWNQWIETTTCLAGVESVLPPDKCTAEEAAALESQIGSIYQGQKALEISARLEAIVREKETAKRALDQTLAAYNELRTAWPMHKKYMKIYDSLIKYRDKMVEIRNQVEEFPSKFIDASTTKCT